MASVQLVAERTGYAEGETMVFRAQYAGLTPGGPPVTVTGPGRITATLSDGTVIEDDSDSITVTRPATGGQTVVSEVVTFRGRTLTKRADGAFTGPATVS